MSQHKTSTGRGTAFGVPHGEQGGAVDLPHPRSPLLASQEAGGGVVTATVLYFGCLETVGHHLWLPSGLPAGRKHGAPWSLAELDTQLCYTARRLGYHEQVEGLACVHHRTGWTALAFYDRSVDHRGNSNSVFLAEGTHDFDAMVALAKEHFPTVWARFRFEVREHIATGGSSVTYPRGPFE